MPIDYSVRADPVPAPTEKPPDYGAALPIDSCARCYASIRWAITAKGKRCPVDAFPIHASEPIVCSHERGAVVFTGPDTIRFLTHGERPRYQERVYRSHFASCPHAKEFSRS